jgi:hypothetical protein
VDRLGWVDQSPHYVSFIDQSVDAAARLVVADRLIAPFELSKQSKLIIGQLRHRDLPWFRPKVAHLNTARDCCDADKGIFREIATYIVRSRGWSVILAIAMGLEGYRHELPRIERCPSSVPGVTYEDMPTGAQQRALAKRGAWIDRHLDNVTQIFSKLVVTSADIHLLIRTIEADQTLVHAAYYTEDECIARIADWIAAKDEGDTNSSWNT